ncbi:MAG TPA: GEVED domain-containing protein [Bacteroidia bacterium]|jgi:hypothetical protein|nr:GEVED domain-containing protein [Bacteroidia bacterium]
MKNTMNIYKLLIFSAAFFITGNLLSQVGVGPAPYCMPQYSGFSRPCNQPGPSNTAGNTINDFINDFNTTGASVNITNNGSGCNSQIFASTSENYFFVACPIFLRVVPGQVVTCNFRSGIIYDQGFALFVDWNNNSLFDLPAERIVAIPGLPPANTWTTGAFTVPAAQAAGTYRMRVRCAYVTTGGIIDPCILYNYGETEDYRLQVGPGLICGVLPVELTAFNSLYINKSTELSWTTATEKNSNYFTVERSYDNFQFEVIAKLPASGNSNSEKNYSTMDKNPKSNSIIYYRLKQYDKGSEVESLSKTITVYTAYSNIGFEMFPNPANTEITLVMPDALVGMDLSISVYDSYGRKVLGSETTVTQYNKSQVFNINEIENGTYFVKIHDALGNVVMKKILLKQ